MQVINVVESLEGKYGPQVKDDNGAYYSFSKFYKGETKLAAGAYSIDLYVSAKGSNYINSLQGSAMVAPPAPVKRVAKVKQVTETPLMTSPKADVSFKPRDFDAEARGKTRCALVEALFSNPNVVQDVAKLQTAPLFLLVDEAVDYIFGDKKVS